MKLSEVDHRTAPMRCPWCDKALDGATGIDYDGAPDMGSLTICIGCGSVSTFGVGGVLSRCPDPVWQAEPEPIPSQIRHARRAILAAHSRRA